jgi:hypothetical protein
MNEKKEEELTPAEQDKLEQIINRILETREKKKKEDEKQNGEKEEAGKPEPSNPTAATCDTCHHNLTADQLKQGACPYCGGSDYSRI